MVNWMMAVHTDATLSAKDPSPLSRVATGWRGGMGGMAKRTLGVGQQSARCEVEHWNKIMVQDVPEINNICPVLVKRNSTNRKKYHGAIMPPHWSS